jgi:hypothetical protein
MGKNLKQYYDYRCQVCDLRLEGPGGAYAEAADNFLLVFSRQDSPFIDQHRGRISSLTMNEVQFGGDERPNFVACSFRVNKPRKTYMQNDKFRIFP